MSNNLSRRMARRHAREHGLDTVSNRKEPQMNRRNQNGGIALLPQQGMAPQGPIFNVGPLVNDVQLVAWLASGMPSLQVADAVQRAQDLIVEAQRRAIDLGKRLAEVGEELKKAAEAAAA